MTINKAAISKDPQYSLLISYSKEVYFEYFEIKRTAKTSSLSFFLSFKIQEQEREKEIGEQ